MQYLTVSVNWVISLLKVYEDVVNIYIMFPGFAQHLFDGKYLIDRGLAPSKSLIYTNKFLWKKLKSFIDMWALYALHRGERFHGDSYKQVYHLNINWENKAFLPVVEYCFLSPYIFQKPCFVGWALGYIFLRVFYVQQLYYFCAYIPFVTSSHSPSGVSSDLCKFWKYSF